MKPDESEQIDWEDVRSYVVDKIRAAGRKIDVDKVRKFVDERSEEYGPRGKHYEKNFDRFVDKLTKSGYLTPSEAYSRHTRGSSSRERREGRNAASSEDFGDELNTGLPEEYFETTPERRSIFTLFHKYRERIERKLRRSRTGFRVHLSVYAGVNLFLLMIWGITGGGFPWFIIPAAGWAIGIANHFNMLRQRARQSRETASLPDLTDKETRLVKAMHDARSSFGSHLTTALSTSVFFTIIHAITTPGGFPWHYIPSAGMALAVFIHYANYGPKVRRMRKTITHWIQDRRKHGTISEERERAAGIEDREPAIVQEASAIRRAIIMQAESAKSDGIDIGNDLETLLATYVEQIRSLVRKKGDMDRIVADLPIVALQKDRANLVGRRTRAENDAVKTEYDKSIAEVDQQIASLKEIEQNREVLDLRLRSAMNLMKQLQLDLARAKGAAITNTTSFEMLRSKSSELSDYIQDLEAGYSEIDT